MSPSIELSSPQEVVDSTNGDVEAVDEYDAVVVLSSDRGSTVLSAEEALFGNVDSVNEVDVTHDLSGVFEKVDRRTGFVGNGLPAEKLDSEEIPEDAPLSMGFKSGFQGNQPSESKVSIQQGPFTDGTTMQISRLKIDLDRWYENGDEERIKRMFSPDHTREQVGSTGEPLGSDSGITEEIAEKVVDDAETHHQVGHSQKLACARDSDFDPLILRRSEGIATDSGDVEFNFISIQQGISDFIETRKAMDAHSLDDDVPNPHHGIRDYFSVQRRGTYLVPPRKKRALPAPNPD